MAEGRNNLSFLNNDKDLEEGEINDLEEGEIEEDCEGISEYRFSVIDEKTSNENELIELQHISLYKSDNFTRNQRNPSRKTRYLRDRNERRIDARISRGHEKSGRKRDSFKHNFAGKRRDDSLRGNRHRVREIASAWNEDPNSYSSNFDNNYSYKARYESCEISSDTNEGGKEDEEFKSLLEQYKHMKEELDQIGSPPKHSSLVDDVIDDSFVDVPLDDMRNSDAPQDELDAEIRRLELDFSHELGSGELVHSDGTRQIIPSVSQTIPTTYENNEQNYDIYTDEQPFFGLFEPFKIKPASNKVRTLSELNQMDLASRGLVNDDNSKSDIQGKPKGKTKAKRRPNKGARQRMKRRETSHNQSGRSSNDVYEELGVGVGTQANGSHRTREWEMVQGNVESFADDCKPTPMEVETDSTESIGVIEESRPPLPPVKLSHPHLPPVDLAQPPPPGEDIGITSTSCIMPLMDVKPYGYFHDYGSPWWGGPELPPAIQQPYVNEHSSTVHEGLSTSYENTELQQSENNDTQVLEENSLNLSQQTDLEVEDEASELALREQLLKSMVTKRAAKNAGKVNEKSAASSVASPGNSRASSPFVEPGTRKGMQEAVKKETVKVAKVNVAPPKHEPVVIHLGADSEDTESESESPVKKKSNSFFGGLDSFLKEARERSTKSKAESKGESDDKDGVESPTPTTPEVVSVLPKEKRNEYKKLKLQLAMKEQRKEANKKDSGSPVNMATKQTQEKKQMVKHVEDEKQRLPTTFVSRQTEIATQVQEEHQLNLLQKQQNRRQHEQRHPEQQQEHHQQQQQQPRTQEALKKQDKIYQQQKAGSTPQQDPNPGLNHELKVKVKILSEMLLGHKRLIMQDQKLLESCKDQLSSSSKALSEHQSRVSLLQQQLQQAERLKKVQQDIVEKLKIQNVKLNQRMSQRQSDAREVKERLLRTRALLVAQKSQKTLLTTGKNSLPQNTSTVSNPGYQNQVEITTGERTLAAVRPAALSPRQDSHDVGMNSKPSSSKALNENGEKFQEMSRILKESIPSEKEVKKPQSREDSSSMSKPSISFQTSTEDKQTLEKKRLRILEQKLSQKLRQSSARRRVGKESESHRKAIGKESGTGRKLSLQDQRPSSDSELVVKRNHNSRGLTPPVELIGGREVDEEDGGLRTPLLIGIFKDNDKLTNIRRFQAERETSGPSFTRVCNNLALPVRFRSTKCAWLRADEIGLSQYLDDISGCLSAVVPQEVSGSRRSVPEQTQWNRRATGPYRSPLVYFRSYRFSPYYRTKKGFTLDSHTFTHLINPRVPFCPFALHGICSDPECPHQHPDDAKPTDKQILEDLAAYFATAGKKVSGNNDDVMKSIANTIDAVAKQYGDKVSPSELRVLFVNYLRKQKSAGIFNIVLERRRWRPISHTIKDLGTTSPSDKYPVVQTENTFSWKSWRRKIENEIKTRSGDRDECQEIRYFSENYDSIKTMEKATQENPSDETLWLRLAMVHMGPNRTEGDTNNNDNRKNVDRALNTLAQALEYNRHSEKLWLKYLDVFRQRATKDELYEVCEEAVELAGSYNVWWAYLEISSDYQRKTDVCLKCIEFLLLSDAEGDIKSHRLLETFLHLTQLDVYCDLYKLALNRFQVALSCANSPQNTQEILLSLAENMTCDDLCLLWLSYIHLVEFSCLPRTFYDPAQSGPAKIVRKDGVVFPWKPGGGTRHGFPELLKLFHRALKECAGLSNSPDKVSPVFWLYKNLIALDRASGKDASSLQTCQRLLKASPKNIQLWLCMATLQQVSGNEDGAMNVYKKALETCDGHAQIAYCAAKYFLETENHEECYEALTACVYSKFVLEVPSPGPQTRARSHDQPTILRPNPELLYKKLLSQTLPLDSEVPAAKPGVCLGSLGEEGMYVRLCYCLFIELFSDKEPIDRHLVTQAVYESAVYSTGDRHEVKTFWTEYLYYMARGLKEKLCKSEQLHDIFHKCLTTVPAVTPGLYKSSRSWLDYSFHNEILALYRRCSGDAFSSSIYEKYMEMFPDNSILAIQTVEYLYEHRELEKARKILSAILLKTPYCLDLWKIAISIELKQQNFDQARQLYEHATEALPLAVTLWKDFAMFELAHDSNKMEGLQSVLNKAKERGFNLEDFLKKLTSKDG